MILPSQRYRFSSATPHAVSRGVIYPLTRDDLIQAAATVLAVRAGELDRLRVPENPLDILAQQCVATIATGDIGVDELFALVRRAHSFRSLPRADFAAVVDVLSEGVATKRGRRCASSRNSSGLAHTSLESGATKKGRSPIKRTPLARACAFRRSPWRNNKNCARHT